MSCSHKQSNTTKQACGQWNFRNGFNPVLVSCRSSQTDTSGPMIIVMTNSYHNDRSDEQGENGSVRFMPQHRMNANSILLSGSEGKVQGSLQEISLFLSEFKLRWEPHPSQATVCMFDYHSKCGSRHRCAISTEASSHLSPQALFGIQFWLWSTMPGVATPNTTSIYFLIAYSNLGQWQEPFVHHLLFWGKGKRRVMLHWHTAVHGSPTAPLIETNTKHKR